MGVLGVIYFFLDKVEQAQDELEKRLHLHNINFDAL
jgi:hypothetical protein